MRRSRGFTTVEMIVGGVVTTSVLAGALYGIVNIYDSQTYSTSMPNVQNEASNMAIMVAASLRDSTDCSTADAADSPCTWTGGPVQSPSSSGVTVYERLSSGLVENVAYSINSGTFTVATTTGSGGSQSTSTQSLYSGATLSITYYQTSGGSYHVSSLSSYTPTSSTSSNLVGATITATVTQGKFTGSYTTTVRLRNNPPMTATAE